MACETSIFFRPIFGSIKNKGSAMAMVMKTNISNIFAFKSSIILVPNKLPTTYIMVIFQAIFQSIFLEFQYFLIADIKVPTSPTLFSAIAVCGVNPRYKKAGIDTKPPPPTVAPKNPDIKPITNIIVSSNISFNYSNKVIFVGSYIVYNSYMDFSKLKYLIVSLLLIAVFSLLFLYFKSQVDDIKTIHKETIGTIEQYQLEQNEKYNTQEALYEKMKNDFEKYRMMALETKELVDSNKQPEISNIVRKWRPYTAYIICSWTEPKEAYGSGSGKIEKLDEEGNALILTNKHVLFKEDSTPEECLVTFPEITKIYKLEKPKVESDDALDVAYLTVTEPDQFILSLITNVKDERLCLDGVSLGDKIIALGYPGIGTSGDVTVTDGIISGSEDEFYISTVKLDYGNSGGLAVHVEKNCYLGIPTASVAGEIESLARILKYSEIMDK